MGKWGVHPASSSYAPKGLTSVSVGKEAAGGQPEQEGWGGGIMRAGKAAAFPIRASASRAADL